MHRHERWIDPDLLTELHQKADRFAASERGRNRGRGGRRPDGFRRHGGFGPGFGGPMFGRGPRVGRGDVRAAILALLAEAPMHGYQMINELAERSGGVWRPSPGSVYPTLQVLEDEGLVTADRTEGRRVFTLTAKGREVVAAMGEGPAPWDDAARDVDHSLVDLRGLMFQVGAAIIQAGQAGTDEQVQQVKDILTDTRRKIYRVLAEDPDTSGSETGPSEA